ncbi:transposase [Methylomonas sp. LL1]|uniref:transposase n=1 Tax=Methylomonas sp. LL1 TaxID=2785785 RepID=UPI0018C3C15A|nr:transposase [Methylomonas sp. LL1]
MSFGTLLRLYLERFKRRTPDSSKSVEFRVVLNGIFYLLKRGCQWAFLPSLYVSKSTVHKPFQRCTRASVFAEMFNLGRRSIRNPKDPSGTGWQSGADQPATRQSTSLSAEAGVGRNPTDRGKSDKR